MALGEKIREARTKKRISQDELSRRIGVAQRLISGYENNKIVPSTEVIKKMAEIFGVTTDYLIYGKDSESKGIVVDRELLKYMSIIDRMSEDDKKFAKRLLRSIITDTKIRETDID